TAKPGSTLVINPDDDKKFEVDVNGSGAWSFKAPDSFGAYSFGARAKDGFNESDSIQHEVDVTLPAPKLTSPADGDTVPVHRVPRAITGSGNDRASVDLKVNGKDAGTADVSDGQWRISMPERISTGDHRITATQTSDGVRPKKTSIQFTVTDTPAGN